ncbi:hypothetical protein J2T50_000272 [Streptococcus gallinaceus]|uniref:hypothetical protein n=1 Tax=Streptococcus gallinaceus TaxID=165758 RepID=UPI0020A1A01A|nr:hypothetical protein [Streptococcus gallinaceus]MCP1638579.1 hypothetical protein [Streptococcus gallinaceus]MCP1769334.1 hypothetical protein [Streptococcus gallinaceus]
MNLKHRVRINMTDSDGNKQAVLRGGVRNIPRRIAQWLFGENLEILVLAPGQSVESVEIHEIRKGEDTNE